jgi:lysozyme family protein
MTDAFGTCLAVLLKMEGGYVNDPRDPGGMTNLGIARTTWQDWTGKPASESDMRALTPEKVAPLYAARYWNVNHCADLPAALALCVFSFGVTSNPNRAARYLQKLVGAAQDGVVGPGTLKAVQAFVASHGIAEAVRQYQDLRRGFYRSLSDFGRFGRGWINRVNDEETAALRMIGGAK